MPDRRAAGVGREPQRDAARAAAHRLGADSSASVSLPSTPRCSRIHVVNGRRAMARDGTSARSSTTTPNPPALQHETEGLDRAIERCAPRRSSRARWPARRLRRWPRPGATGSCPRAQSRCDSSMPAAAPDGGSNRSSASTSATISPRRVAAASVAHSTAVRPEDAGPTISDSFAAWPPARHLPIQPRQAGRPSGASGFGQRMRGGQRDVELSSP